MSKRKFWLKKTHISPKLLRNTAIMHVYHNNFQMTTNQPIKTTQSYERVEASRKEYSLQQLSMLSVSKKVPRCHSETQTARKLIQVVLCFISRTVITYVLLASLDHRKASRMLYFYRIPDQFPDDVNWSSVNDWYTSKFRRI